MRENTRCEVDEPISTPTLSTTISSSSTRERPVLEKKIRPPALSSFMPVSADGRHGRACPGHPRLHLQGGREVVDARHEAGHDDWAGEIVAQAPTNFGTVAPFL